MALKYIEQAFSKMQSLESQLFSSLLDQCSLPFIGSTHVSVRLKSHPYSLPLSDPVVCLCTCCPKLQKAVCACSRVCVRSGIQLMNIHKAAQVNKANHLPAARHVICKHSGSRCDNQSQSLSSAECGFKGQNCGL